jgi:hypothetical protein
MICGRAGRHIPMMSVYRPLGTLGADKGEPCLMERSLLCDVASGPVAQVSRRYCAYLARFWTMESLVFESDPAFTHLKLEISNPSTEVQLEIVVCHSNKQQ